MSKMVLELGGKYTAGDAFSKAQNDIKSFGKENRDAIKAGTDTLKELEKYGSKNDPLRRKAELFLLDCGVSQADIAAIRNIFLEKIPPNALLTEKKSDAPKK